MKPSLVNCQRCGTISDPKETTVCPRCFHLLAAGPVMAIPSAREHASQVLGLTLLALLGLVLVLACVALLVR